MGSYRREIWQARPDSGSRRDDRRGGAFLAYQPDSLSAMGLVVSPGLARRAAQAESAVRDVCSGARSRPTGSRSSLPRSRGEEAPGGSEALLIRGVSRRWWSTGPL